MSEKPGQPQKTCRRKPEQLATTKSGQNAAIKNDGRLAVPAIKAKQDCCLIIWAMVFF